jgi:SAM-dependent methyltransferase
MGTAIKEVAHSGSASMSENSHSSPAPSPWVVRFAPLVPAGGRVLDLACGAGRHARFFRDRGHPVTAVDRDTSALAAGAAEPDLRIIEADLEDGRPFPVDGERFAGVVVTNYLHRPILPTLVQAVAPGGVLIYETFSLDQPRFGRPRNPDFLLHPGELLEAVRGRLRVLAYEDLILDTPAPRAVQRICARRETDSDSR